MESEVNMMNKERNTKNRKAVMNVLQNASRPITAMEIQKILIQSGEASWISSIYRALEYYEVRHEVIKTFFLNSDKAYYQVNRSSHTHFGVCTKCNSVVELIKCPLENIDLIFEKSKFKISAHRLELYGICESCQLVFDDK